MALESRATRKSNKTAMISVRFDPETLQDLEALAGARGLPVSTIVRMWTLQRLAQEAPDRDPWVTRQMDLPD